MSFINNQICLVCITFHILSSTTSKALQTFAVRAIRLSYPILTQSPEAVCPPQPSPRRHRERVNDAEVSYITIVVRLSLQNDLNHKKSGSL